MPDVTFSLTVLTEAGLPRSALNVSALHSWGDSEGMPDWANNYLASHLATPNSTQYDASGVRAYSTFNHGVEATIATLREARFAAIWQALADNAGYRAIWTAINRSPWRPHAQNGLYPVALYELIAHPEEAITAPSAATQTAELYDWSQSVKVSGESLAGSASRASRTSAALRGLAK